MTPFLSFYTPTFRRANGELARPTALAQCTASVASQELPHGITVQHAVIEDVVLGGSGVGGMFAQVPGHAGLMRGDYVHLLADDDELASVHAVAQVHAFADAHGRPPVILVNSWKHFEYGWLKLPVNWAGVPVLGQVDLGCVITRRDVWTRHVADYGAIYESDFLFIDALHKAGHAIARLDIDFVRGAVMRGRTE